AAEIAEQRATEVGGHGLGCHLLEHRAEALADRLEVAVEQVVEPVAQAVLDVSGSLLGEDFHLPELGLRLAQALVDFVLPAVLYLELSGHRLARRQPAGVDQLADLVELLAVFLSRVDHATPLRRDAIELVGFAPPS